MKLASYMMTNCNSSSRGIHAFSLIELLVVISIIAILSTAGLSVGLAVKRTAMRTQAHTDCLAIEHSLDNYYALEHRFPRAWDGPQRMEGAFLSTLMGKRSEFNRAGTRYFETSKVHNNPRGAGFVVQLNCYNDPWGTPYQVHLDVSGEDVVALPGSYAQRFGTEMTGRAIFVESAGPDRDFDTVTDNVTCFD